MQKLSLKCMATTTYSALISLLPGKVIFDTIISFGLCFGLEKQNFKELYSDTLSSQEFLNIF